MRVATPLSGLLSVGLCTAAAATAEFVEFDQFSTWTCSALGDGIRLVSPILGADTAWDELVPSWNVHLANGQAMTVEVAPLWPGEAPRFYVLGCWTSALESGGRRSFSGQHDTRGAVDTDTLVLHQPARAFQVRLDLRGAGVGTEAVRYLGCALSAPAPTREDSGFAPPSTAWGTTLAVPALCQLDSTGGDGWCSPTSLAMLLQFWSRKLARPDLHLDVARVAAGVDDPAWPGTGNWAFNAAFAGSLDGLRSRVVRLSDVRDLEPWLESGMPVAASVSYGILKAGAPEPNDGHLVVVVGFSDEGEVVVNDPGSRVTPRRLVSRARFDAAWAVKRRTVYLVHPDSWSPPLPPGTPWRRNPSATPSAVP